MFSSSFSYKSILILLVTLTILIPILFIPFFNNQQLIQDSLISNSEITISLAGFAWPTPGVTRITSTYGYRKSPTGNLGNFHSGLDIGAPEGTYLVAICDGEIVFTGWSRFWWLCNYFSFK